MPAATVKSYAQKSGKSVATVERYWDAAKKSADAAWKGKKKDEHYWAYVSGIVKKRCGLTESLTFKEFMELEFDQPQSTGVQAAGAVDSPETPQNNYGRFISCIFAARDKAHQLHLASKSYSQHVALNELYELLAEFGDEMTEAFQGKHGIVTIGVPAADGVFDQPDANSFICALTEWLESSGRSWIGSDSFIINLFEELIGEVYRVKYKLENLA